MYSASILHVNLYLITQVAKKNLSITIKHKVADYISFLEVTDKKLSLRLS